MPHTKGLWVGKATDDHDRETVAAIDGEGYTVVYFNRAETEEEDTANARIFVAAAAELTLIFYSPDWDAVRSRWDELCAEIRTACGLPPETNTAATTKVLCDMHRAAIALAKGER